MRKFQWLVPILVVTLMFLMLPAGVVFAASTADVTINATPSYVSISVNNTTYDFGAVTASSTPNTGTGYFGVTNGSSVTTTTTIVSNGWQSGGTAWTWGNAGSDTGEMNASDGDGLYDITVNNATPINLKVSQAATTDWVFELQLEAPTAFTHGDAQGTTITISATAD